MAKANETKEEVKVVTEEKKEETKTTNKNNSVICIVITTFVLVLSHAFLVFWLTNLLISSAFLSNATASTNASKTTIISSLFKLISI